MYILGLSFFYHDSSACLLKDGEIVAAASEERFSRQKHDAGFPGRAIAFCLDYAGISSNDLDYVVFYEKPFLKFERILFTHFKNWPRGFYVFNKILNVWLKEKLRIRGLIRGELKYKGKILFAKHHLSHAASAFFASPFEEAAVATVDGVGEWATAAIGIGKGNSIKILKEMRFPDSLGLLYSAFTYFLGFKVNDGEYKVMGLAPYGKPKYADLIKKHLVKIYPDGSVKINPDYFQYEWGGKMINLEKFEKLFGVKKREPDGEIKKEHQDIASSIQIVLEEAMLNLCRYAKKITNSRNLCLAGGVALNCVCNSRILNSGIFEDVFVFPAASDAGGAVGAALCVWHEILQNPREPKELRDVFWGPEFKNEEIEKILLRAKIPYEKLSNEELIRKIALLLTHQKIVGWFQGRMEFGPRALGNRSILADPRNKENWQKVNLKIKFRESFRPFAPAILEEFAPEFFDFKKKKSPFMLFTAASKTAQIPAVIHIDNSSRIQTVSFKENPLFYGLIKEFYRLTGAPALINTSFNTSGMPIVCAPQNAYQCFMFTEMDVLVLGNFVLYK